MAKSALAMCIIDDPAQSRDLQHCVESTLELFQRNHRALLIGDPDRGIQGVMNDQLLIAFQKLEQTRKRFADRP